MARLIALIAVFATMACNSTDGRTLAEPSPELTATTAAPTIDTAAPAQPTNTVLPQLAGADGLTVSSAAFGPGGAIPAEYSCMVSPDGPPLSWSQVPTGTVELAVVVTDLGARDFVQWIVTGIPPDVDRLEPPAFPEGAQQGVNDTGETGWFGPCPAPGEGRQYLFSLYPVTAPLDLPAGTGGRDAAAAIAAASLEPATVAGFYTAA